jgi:Flp pilus assembly protein TadG
MIEVAISLAVFLLLIMGTIDFGFLLSTKVTLQNAVRQAGRYAITGNCVTQSNGTCNRYNSIIQTLQNASTGLLNNSNTGDITISCLSNGGGCPNNAGGPGDVVTITVNYPYHFLSPLISTFFSNRPYNVKVSAAFTNEAFPPASS